ncbi:hypothetical protein SDC9_179384 [bioreactor metagenome]|uniref:Uncharacterized protein n=1 Tax=bioreactor metagenome TaxID=1076179 RepID=A0A645H1N7_9ZZZZ
MPVDYTPEAVVLVLQLDPVDQCTRHVTVMKFACRSHSAEYPLFFVARAV